MGEIIRYDQTHESGLIALLKAEPDWNSFTGDDRIDAFRKALVEGETYVCESQGRICGYLRAMVDGLGIYVSELYVEPVCRNNGYGKALLEGIKQQHPDRDVYVFSDGDWYYEKLGYKRVGSVFQM